MAFTKLIPSLAAGLLLAAVSLPAAAQTVPGQTVPALTDDIRPVRTSGLGLRVSNLERSKKFYTEVLGMKVDLQVGGANGAPVREYLLGMTGDRNVDTLVVLSQGEVKPDAPAFGRIVIVVPNGRKMAERVKAHGGSSEKLVDGTNIVKDPDGYVIELYQRPAPKP